MQRNKNEVFTYIINKKCISLYVVITAKWQYGNIQKIISEKLKLYFYE